MRLNLLKDQRGLRVGLLALAFFWGALLPADALDLVIKATADETKLGFTEGQAVTFTFRINPSFVDTSDSGFSGSGAVWGSSGADIPIFSWVGITGVSGSFSPVIGGDSNSSLSVGNQGGMTVDISYESLGYLADGEVVFTLAGSFALLDPEFFNVPGEYVDPTTYLMSYQGSYPIEAFGFGIVVNPGDPDFIGFTVNELQIVPEPSSVILISVSALGIVWMGRRRRIG